MSLYTHENLVFVAKGEGTKKIAPGVGAIFFIGEWVMD